MIHEAPKEDLDKKPGYLPSIFKNKCPRCRHGDLFQSKNPYALKRHAFMKMHEKCPVCGQPTEIEVGFYYGTSYVSYALTIALSVATFIAWKVLFGLTFDVNDDSIFWWFGANVILLLLTQPLFMRLARTLWLSWYVRYNKNWRTEPPKDYERTNKDLQNAW